MVTLDDIRDAVPPADQTQVHRAEQILAEELADFSREMSIRGIGSDIATLHTWADAHVESELIRLGDADSYSPGQVAQSLHRLANALVHLPTMVLRQAAAQGRIDQVLDDINEITTGYLASHETVCREDHSILPRK